jgi:hypothetical protein
LCPRTRSLTANTVVGAWAYRKKQGIMPHAQPHDNVKIHLRFVQHFGLGYGTAHAFKLTGAHFFIFCEAYFFLGRTSHLTYYGYHAKTMRFQNPGQGGCFRLQPDTISQAEPLVAHFCGKFAYFLQTWFYRMKHRGLGFPVYITLPFLNGRLPGKFPDMCIRVRLPDSSL